ncbi:MAG: sulfotransferase [Bacteroidota bacterium]
MTKHFNQWLQKVRKLNEVRKSKRLVFIVSTMRSGSTLLKSLIAQAPDTSHLPEIDFQKYTDGKAWKLKAMSKANIIVLKKPAPLQQEDYPQFPAFTDHRILLLVRDVYPTVHSVKRMLRDNYPQLDADWPLEKLVEYYWCPTIQRMLHIHQQDHKKTMLIKYEDLLEQPIAITQGIFQFIGSAQQEGIDQYAQPKDYQWQWGNDDGGEKIKTLKVQKQHSDQNDTELLNIIQQSEQARQLRQQLAYAN